jgi:hypothetical protein
MRHVGSRSATTAISTRARLGPPVLVNYAFIALPVRYQRASLLLPARAAVLARFLQILLSYFSNHAANLSLYIFTTLQFSHYIEVPRKAFNEHRSLPIYNILILDLTTLGRLSSPSGLTNRIFKYLTGPQWR